MTSKQPYLPPETLRIPCTSGCPLLAGSDPSGTSDKYAISVKDVKDEVVIDGSLDGNPTGEIDAKRDCGWNTGWDE